MPRAVDPPGRYPTADFDPGSRNVLFDPATMPKIDWLKMVRDWVSKGVTWLVDTVKYLTGGRIDLGPIREIFDDILDDIRNDIGTGQNIIKLYRKILSIIADATGFNLIALLAGVGGIPGLQAFLDLIPNLRSMLSGGLLGGGGLIPIGWLTTAQPNLLEDIGSFPTLASIAENPWWIWDPDITATPDGTGSARVDADGATRALRSIQVPVVPEQPVNAQISLRWQNLDVVGGVLGGERPLRLQLVPFAGNVELAPVDIASVLLPLANNDWMTIAGDWTAPSNVDAVRMRLLVTDAALAGTIWWDRGVLKRTGGILEAWVKGLTENLQTIRDFVQGVVDVLWSVFSRITGQVGKNLDDLKTAAQGVVTTVFGIIDTMWGVFSGVAGQAGKTLGDLQTAATQHLSKLATDIGALIDRLWAAFNQVALQPGKTITDLTNAAQNAIAGPGGVMEIVNNLVTRVFGMNRPLTHEESADAIEALKQAGLDNSQALRDFMNSLTTGRSVSDNFQRTAANLGPDWAETYGSGSGIMRTRATASPLGAQGAFWEPQGPGWGGRSWTGIWQASPATSLTDYQEVGVVLASAAGSGALLYGTNMVICRWATNNFVRFEVRGNQGWALVYVLNGTAYTVATGTLPYMPGPGAFVRIQAGDLDANLPRRFRCFLGTDLIHLWDDPNLSAMGAGFRGWGWATDSQGIILASTFSPATTAQFLARDQ